MNNDQTNQDNGGQGGLNAETEQRNRENQTGQQGNTTTGQAPGQTGIGEQTRADQAEAGQSTDQATDQGGSGFVGSGGDQSSDYLTEGEQDFAPEGQGATDTDAGNSDIETGEPNKDSSNPSL